ncbi:hypothetical protein IRJ41_023119 [Triplophysa rosa]|uniref:Transmembrane protein 109 n=1 Tax=Triplophysa rosa TaxID=992332 RepID=A0A9W7TN61_TRIRA|nr:hypothetical protein IRJ41_023119 [Triplophysa rosa]
MHKLWYVVFIVLFPSLSLSHLAPEPANPVTPRLILCPDFICSCSPHPTLPHLSLTQNAVLYLDSVFGPENVYSVAMFVEMLLKLIAEGAASGLNVIAVYVSEILRATGVSETISIPHFTTEGVSAVIKWALLALIGYSILSVVLRVTVALVRRVFWLLKVILVLWLFVRIVSDPSASTELIAMRLTLLVLICAVIGIVTSSTGGNGAGLEKRVRSLEGEFKMEKRKTE